MPIYTGTVDLKDFANPKFLDFQQGTNLQSFQNLENFHCRSAYQAMLSKNALIKKKYTIQINVSSEHGLVLEGRTLKELLSRFYRIIAIRYNQEKPKKQFMF